MGTPLDLDPKWERKVILVYLLGDCLSLESKWSFCTRILCYFPPRLTSSIKQEQERTLYDTHAWRKSFWNLCTVVVSRCDTVETWRQINQLDKSITFIWKSSLTKSQDSPDIEQLNSLGNWTVTNSRFVATMVCIQASGELFKDKYLHATV